MKLLIATGIYPPEIGGPAGYVKGVATELAGQGHEVAVVTYGDSPELNSKYQIVGVPRTSYVVHRYWKYFLEVYKLAKKSDVVYAQGPVSEGLPAALASIFARKPLILKVVGDYAWEQYQQYGTNYESAPITNGLTDDRAKYEIRPSSRAQVEGNTKYELLDEFVTHRHKGKIWLMEAVERWVASRAKQIIVPSKYLKTVVEKWGIRSEKIKVIYNSISPLPEVDSREELRDKHGLGNRKLILTAVRAVPWKGGDFLCDVLKELPEDFVLAVAGDGPSLELWKKHAEELGVSDRVAWLGKLNRKDLTEFYRASDIFVLPTGYEGFPHVVVEAASMGLSCIVSNKGGNPEIAELFPGLVTVAEYQNKQAWVEAVTSSNVERQTSNGGLPEMLGFNRMVTETFAILESAHCLNLDSHDLHDSHDYLNNSHRLNLDLQADSRSNLHDYSNHNICDELSEKSRFEVLSSKFDVSRVLSIGLEKKLFEDGKVRDRIVNQLDGFDATIIVFSKQKFDEQITPNLRVISTNSWNKFFYVTDALRIVWKLRKQKFAVITSQDPTETGLVAYLASKLCKSALAIQDHGYHFHGNYYRQESWLNQFRYLFARFIVTRAEAIRVVSQRTEDALTKLGVPRERIVRFPLTLGINSPRSSTSSEHPSLKLREGMGAVDSGQGSHFAKATRDTAGDGERWTGNREQRAVDSDEGLDSQIPDSRFFLVICRFVPIKRIDLAIHAFSIFAKQNPDVKLKIVGAGPLEDQIKQWIADFDLQSRVEIIPWTNDLAELYRGAIATLITSDREGFGMTAIESLACGTPVIMTDVGCAHEVVKNGENGIIVPVGDVIALANAMEKLIQSQMPNDECQIIEAYGINSTTDSAVRGSGLESRLAVRSSMFASEANMKDFLLSAISYQLSAKEKLEEEMGRFEEKGESVETEKIKLMLYTPSLDHADPVFGFSVRWADEFARQTEKLVIISRFVGEGDVPRGSIGIAVGKPWFSRVIKLWSTAIKYRKQYDKVFVHMSPEVVLVGWPIWFVLRKPIYLWYAHGAIPLALKLAEPLVKLIFASSETGLRLQTPKARFVGQGIDTELFKPNPQIKKENIIITISRITPAKKYEDSLEFLAKYKEKYPNDKWIYQIVGPSLGYEEYIETLKHKAEQLGLADRFHILPAVEYTQLPAVYQRAKLFLSTSETGSIDKVVLEALSCGVPVIARGGGYQKITGVTSFNDKEVAMQKLHNLLETHSVDVLAREGVIKEHGLARLISLILDHIK